MIRKLIFDDLMSAAQDLLHYFGTRGRGKSSSHYYLSVSPPRSNPVSSRWEYGRQRATQYCTQYWTWTEDLAPRNNALTTSPLSPYHVLEKRVCMLVEFLLQYCLLNYYTLKAAAKSIIICELFRKDIVFCGLQIFLNLLKFIYFQ